MQEQDLLNKASRKYLEMQELLRRIHNSNGIVSLKELYNEFDIFLQILLMYTSMSNHEILDIELVFIDKLTIEKDIIEEYNQITGKNLNWKTLKNTYLDLLDFNNFFDETYKIFYGLISKFIMLFSSVDSYTKTDFLSLFNDGLKEIMLDFIKIRDNSKEEEKFVDFVLNKMFVSKVKEQKELFNIKLTFKD